MSFICIVLCDVASTFLTHQRAIGEFYILYILVKNKKIHSKIVVFSSQQNITHLKMSSQRFAICISISLNLLQTSLCINISKIIAVISSYIALYHDYIAPNELNTILQGKRNSRF